MSIKYQCQTCGAVRELNEAFRMMMLRNGFVPVEVEDKPKPTIPKPQLPAKSIKPKQEIEEVAEEEEDLRLEE